MNILLAPVLYLPIKSGVPVFTHQLAKALLRKGHQVVVVTPLTARSHPSFELVDGIEVHRLPFAFPMRMLWQQPFEGLVPFVLHGLPAFRRLERLIAKKHLEVIHVQSLTGSHIPYMLFAQFITKRPLVVTLHGNDFVRWNLRQMRVRRVLARSILRRAASITAVASHVAREAVQLCPQIANRVVTIPNWVAVDEYSETEGFAFPAPYILSLARLNPLKGHDVLLTAFQRVAERDKTIHLIIAGDGPQRVRLHAITLALGLQDRVTFLGEVNRETVKRLLAGCKYLVFASWSEGIPLAAIEGMASRRAVIGTRVGGFPEIVFNTETGILVPPGDPRSLAEALLFLLKHPDKAKVMGEKAQAFVHAHHNLAQAMERYLDVYRKCLPHVARGGPSELEIS